MEDLPRLAEVTRSGAVESVHRGSVAVVRRGAPLLRLGDTESPVWCRSAVKPLQALPLVESGAARRLGLDSEELALTCASHNGTPHHVDIARRLLARGGFTEDDLLCGPHAPFDKRASLEIAVTGQKPTRLHNNCSGKHSGFLLLAAENGVPKADYLDPESASQRLIRRAVAEMAEVQVDEVTVGLDGCGAPTLGLPLLALARAFANLANPEQLAPVRREACRSLFDAASAHPVTLAGEGRLCTALLRHTQPAIFPKNGAEGVYAFGLPGRGIGVAIKVEDGAERGYVPVVVDLLRALGVFDSVPDGLAAFHSVPIRNTQKRAVGACTCTVTWPELR